MRRTTLRSLFATFALAAAAVPALADPPLAPTSDQAKQELFRLESENWRPAGRKSSAKAKTPVAAQAAPPAPVAEEPKPAPVEPPKRPIRTVAAEEEQEGEEEADDQKTPQLPARLKSAPTPAVSLQTPPPVRAPSPAPKAEPIEPRPAPVREATKENPPKAAPVDEAANDQIPDRDLQLRLARNAVKLGRYQEAIGRFETLLARQPGDAAVRAEYAGVLITAERLQEAERQYRKLLEQTPDSRDLQLKIVNLHFQMKNWGAAIAQLRSILEASPRDVETAILLARAYTFAENYDAAFEVYRRLLQGTPPKNEEAVRELGALLFDLQQPDEAIRLLEPLRATRANDFGVLSILARSYAMIGDDGMAQQLVDQAAAVDPRNKFARLELANFLRIQKSYGPAMSVYQQILAAEPTAKEAKLGQARVLIEDYRYKEARDILSELAAVMGPERSYRQTVGYYHVLLDETEVAKATFRQLLCDDPNDTKSRVDLGDVYESTHEYERAMGEFGKVPVNDPMNWDARVGFAKCLSGLRKWDEANAFCRRMMTERPRRVEPVIQLARNFHKMHCEARGVALLRDWLTLHPEINRSTLAVRLYLARLLLWEGRHEEAYGEFATLNGFAGGRGVFTEYGLARSQVKKGAPQTMIRMVHVPPNDPRFSCLLTDLLMEDDSFSEAIEVAQQLLDADPDNVLAMVRIGDCQSTYKYCGFEQAAIETYNRVLQLSPPNSRARIGLARMHMSAKNYIESVSAYDQLLQADPGYTVAHLEKARTYYAVPDFDGADRVYAEITDVPAEENLRRELAEILRKETDEHRKARLTPLLHTDGGTLRKEIERAVDAEDDAMKVALSRLIVDFDAQAKIRSNASLERQEKQLHGWAFLGAQGPQQQLLRQEPINEEARFDLAQDQSNLHSTQAAAQTYRDLLDVKPYHRQAGIASDRLYLEHGPQLKFLADAFGQRGRGSLANMDRFLLQGWYIQPYRDEDEFVAVGEGLLAYRPLDDKKLYGNRLSARGQYKPFETLLLHAQIDVDQFQSRFTDRANYDVGFNWKIDDCTAVRGTLFGDNVVENGETLRQDIHRHGGTIGADFTPNRRDNLGGTYQFDWYSDHNQANEFDLYYNHRICFLPTELKFISNFHYWDYKEPTQFFNPEPNELFGAIHPYFAPNHYGQASVGLEWTHYLSKDTFKEANLCWYSLRGSVAVDTVGEPFFFGRAAFHKDICLWLSFETAATITESNVYRSWGASAFLVARLRHFHRDACWHSTCCENCHDWNFHPGPCGCW